MFRWCRTACHTPCPANKKLRQKFDLGMAGRPPGGLIDITFVSAAACR
jgi:hypothetical protein